MGASFVGLVATSVVASVVGAPPQDTIIPVSIDGYGEQIEAAVGPSMDVSGRFVAFEVRSEQPGIFVADLTTGTVTRVSPLVSDGSHAFFKPAISRDGTSVAFRTNASLLPEDTHAGFDVYVLESRTGRLTLASVSTAGIAADQGSVHATAMDDSGTIVAFHANATNLVDSDSNHGFDVFVRDLRRGTTVRASVASDGTQANGSSTEPSLSGSGRYVVFQSAATNLIGDSPTVGEHGAEIDAVEQIYVHDLVTGTTELVSRAPDGGPADTSSTNATISANGRFVVYQSAAVASRLAAAPAAHDGGCEGGDDHGGGEGGGGGGEGGCHEEGQAGHLFLYDRMRRQTTMIDLGTSEPAAMYPRLSGDGRTVVFRSNMALVASDSNGLADVYRVDLRTGTVDLVSIGLGGVSANGASAEGSRSISVSGDGRHVAFDSHASNLVGADTDGEPDVFVRLFAPGSADPRR